MHHNGLLPNNARFPSPHSLFDPTQHGGHGGESSGQHTLKLSDTSILGQLPCIFLSAEPLSRVRLSQGLLVPKSLPTVDVVSRLAQRADTLQFKWAYTPTVCRSSLEAGPLVILRPCWPGWMWRWVALPAYLPALHMQTVTACTQSVPPPDFDLLFGYLPPNTICLLVAAKYTTRAAVLSPLRCMRVTLQRSTVPPATLA